MAMQQDTAQAVLDLIKATQGTPSRFEIVRAIYGRDPKFWRDTLLPGVCEYVGAYNLENPTAQIEVDLLAEDDDLRVVVTDKPKARVIASVDWNGVAAKVAEKKPREEVISFLSEAISAYETKRETK